LMTRPQRINNRRGV